MLALCVFSIYPTIDFIEEFGIILLSSKIEFFIYTPHPTNLLFIGGPFLYTFCIRLCGNGGNLWGNTLFEGNNMYPLSSLHSLLLGDTPTVPSPESELLLFSGIY